jgi:hypothetical protein
MKAPARGPGAKACVLMCPWGADIHSELSAGVKRKRRPALELTGTLRVIYLDLVYQWRQVAEQLEMLERKATRRG